VYLELDQGLRESEKGVDSVTVRTVVDLADAGHTGQIVVGTDGARRSLWTSLGGSPGLAWLASSLPSLLARVGLDESSVTAVMRTNAVTAMSWRAPASLHAVGR
jgi:phosphotriesterase-related protein